MQRLSMLGLVCALWAALLAGLVVAAGSNYYTAGVVEFRPSYMGASSAALLQEHLAAYLELIHSAEALETDIIVFPEGTLNSMGTLTELPAPNSTTSCLCQERHAAEFMQSLACAARNTGKYLLLNVKERAACQQPGPCAASGYDTYNTNVVLDRQGCIVSRYRKWNLYLEPGLNRTAEPQFAVFQTDFGVSFGHFICFDMLFYTPAQQLVERLAVRNLIVTKMFKSELPFLTATQLQQGWAWGNNVNLLAAGASLPQGGISGSGIYAGQQGALVRRMVSGAGVRQLLVARVPFDPTAAAAAELPQQRPAVLELAVLQQPLLSEFATQLVAPRNGSSRQRICHSDLCCDFELSTVGAVGLQQRYRYRLGVYVGQRSYEQSAYSMVRLCGVFACRNETLQSCGQLSEAGTAAALQLTQLRIRGEFVRRPRRLLMPSTLDAALYALQPSQLAWRLQERKQFTHVELQLLQPQTELLTFAIYGNYFDEDLNAGPSTTPAD